ncbi:peptidoglycan-binding protein LysM [Flavobacterium sp. JLP]|uniref:peptidoglycan-binding protein LysM n=1 Tax=Flavobacterium sp. JLP TaxID=2783793 RepID=UPI00188CC605|nr:peptidoglycan-binding protein LysM [Flavobacterium sp. JLP]MBF4505750.1 peptidoglycan-binding protein LysM [Flavobacterium sp. JLP]
MYYTEESDFSYYGKFRTYKIMEGDKLQSVAQKLGISARELRRYHNMYCLVADLIEHDFKRYSKFLILAPEKSISDANEVIAKTPKNVSLGKDNKLPFLPRGIDKEYKVKYISNVDDQSDVIEMNVRVKWLATDKNNFHLFEINRRSVYINNTKPNIIMDELAVKTGEFLYPLKIVVDESGKWIDIYNYDEIQCRWKDKKEEILDYFEGEVTEKYVEKIEYTLKNSERLLASLCSDYFLRTFFNGINVKYTADYGFQKDLIFPLEKEAESVFRVHHKIAPNLDCTGFIKIEQEGQYVDSGYGFMYGYSSAKVIYKGIYFLNPNTYTIEQMNLECNIENKKNIKTTIRVELLE